MKGAREGEKEKRRKGKGKTRYRLHEMTLKAEDRRCSDKCPSRKEGKPHKRCYNSLVPLDRLLVHVTG